MKAKILVDVSCDWLQEIRLIHAISEGSHTVVVPAGLADRFVLLRDKLGMRYEIGEVGDLILSPHVALTHADPISRFGTLCRPLVFPSAMVQSCIGLWSNNRPYRFTFAGLINPMREEMIGGWTESNFGEKLPKMILRDRLMFLPKTLRARLPLKPRSIHKSVGDLFIWSSNRGRVFPGKSWDGEYYQLLSKSEFVLCPRGDCVWSYRFFESILCGAIPIVEDSCPAMDGFEYVHTGQDACSLIWDQDVAQHNLSLLKERFTFEPAEVDREVARLFSSQ